MRRKIYNIIEQSKGGDKISLTYDIIMLIAIAVSIIPLMFAEETTTFRIIEQVTVAFFIIDYLLRWMTADYRLGKKGWSFILYPFTGWAIIDLMSILPVLSGCTMSKETMKRSVDLMFSSPSPYLTMEFQGGEPSLVPELLEYGMSYATRLNQEQKRQLRFVLCTNCVNLTDRVLALCKEYDVLISTSLDGPSFLHNRNRGKVDSYERVVAGIEKARSLLGKEKVSALMTTSNEGLNYPVEIVDEYVKLGFQSIFLRALNPYGLATDSVNWEEYTQRFITFYKKAFERILEINKAGTLFMEDFAAIVLRKMLTPYSTGFVDLQSPAGIINSVLVYNYDGYVYASDESRMLAEFKDFTFRLGSVNDNYQDIVYGAKVRDIAYVWCNECLAGCADCGIRAYCGADPVRNYSTQKDAYGYRPASLLCKKYKAIIEYLISLIIERENEVLPIFKRWLV